MNEYAKRAAQIEAEFLAGVENNLDQAKGKTLRGSKWTWTTRSEDERIRELMNKAGQYDREILRSMPKNKTRILTGTEPRWLLGRRRTQVAMASVLSPIEHYLQNAGPAGPTGLADLVAHVKELIGQADVPHLLGVCSPGGFTAEAKARGLELPNVALVLIEPREDGGWQVTGAGANISEAELRLFDPEAVTKKLQRIREQIELQSADLLTAGLSASELAKRLDVPISLVTVAFEQATSSDPELKLSRRWGDALLYRGAPADTEKNNMSMVEWIRQLFSGEGNETRKINTLSERRAKLVQRRDRLYADLAKLEKREADLLTEGKQAASSTVKRRVASQIKQLRDDMNRLNATGKMLSQQVDVISTHIHNLTLLQQGQMAKLPTSEELTADAVRAEEMLEELGADVELAGSLSKGVTDELVSDEELAILKELEEPPTISEKETPVKEAKAPEPTPAPEEKQHQEPQAE